MVNGRTILAAAALAVVFGAALGARADEQKVKESDVPKAVIDSVKKKYPKATLEGFEKETKKDKVLYEINIKDGERKIDVELSDAGKILSEEETISKDALPDAVKKGLADSKYGKWDVKLVEKVVHDEKADDATYELVVTNGEQKFEIVFDKSGKLTKEEEKKLKKKPEAKKGDKKSEDDDDDD